MAIHNPHDKLFKSSLQYPRVAREFLDLYLPDKIKQQIDFNSISYCQNTFIDEQLKLSQTDVLFKCQLDKQEAYLYVLAEHESKVDPLIAFWLMKYMIAIWDFHIKESPTPGKALPLPMIIPIIFYTGEGQYTAARAFWQLFGPYSEEMRTLLQSSFHLVETKKVPETVLKSHIYAGTMSYVMNEHLRKNVKARLEKIIDNLNTFTEQEQSRYAGDLMTYLMGIDNQHNKIDELITIIQNKMSPKLENTMSSLLDKIMAEGERKGRIEGELKGELKGKVEGRLEGELKGELKGKIETAQCMLAEGMELSLIAKVTHLPLPTLKELQKAH